MMKQEPIKSTASHVSMSTDLKLTLKEFLQEEIKETPQYKSWWEMWNTVHKRFVPWNLRNKSANKLQTFKTTNEPSKAVRICNGFKRKEKEMIKYKGIIYEYTWKS